MEPVWLKMIAFLAALAYEMEGIKGVLHDRCPLPGKGGTLFTGNYQGEEVLLSQTGMGRERAEEATKWVIDRYSPQALIATGFAAAVNGRLKPGELVVSPAVYWWEGQPLPSQPCDAGLLEKATSALDKAGVTFAKGDMLTVGRIVSARRPLAETSLKVMAVDMESYWIGQQAAQRGIPFLVVRSISDSLSHPLPPLDSLMDPWGRWHKRKALSYFLGHPKAIARMALLARDSARARDSLTTFFKLLMEGWA